MHRLCGCIGDAPCAYRLSTRCDTAMSASAQRFYPLLRILFDKYLGRIWQRCDTTSRPETAPAVCLLRRMYGLTMCLAAGDRSDLPCSMEWSAIDMGIVPRADGAVSYRGSLGCSDSPGMARN